jgi:hypothetical protein
VRLGGGSVEKLPPWGFGNASHINNMAENPADLLTVPEFASLVEIAKGPLAGGIAPEHAEKLLELGLIMKAGPDYIVTEAGELLLQRDEI